METEWSKEPDHSGDERPLEVCRQRTEVKNLASVSVKVAQSCPNLCDPLDCSLPGFSVHGLLQARILEWVAIPFTRGSS